MSGRAETPTSMQSSMATEVSLKPYSGPPTQAPSPQQYTQLQAPQESWMQPQPLLGRTSNQAGVSSALDGPGPPLLQGSETTHPREARAARRRLDVSVPHVRTSANTPMASPSRSVMSPSVPGSDQGMQGRISRIAARALARGSMRDSGSELSSKVVKDVYRDDRGRRVERPPVVRSDVHIIGEIEGASGFPRAHSALFCRYRMVYDGTKSWTVVRGLEAGCTQVSSAARMDEDFVAWEHPLDVHMSTQKLEGWPSILLLVYSRDDWAHKDRFVSYALCPLPNTPGPHHLTVRTWYPVETNKQNVRNIFAHYVGMAPRLDDDLTDLGYVTDVRMREEAGLHLASVGSGCVRLRLQLLFRHLSGLARQMGDPLFKSLENFQLHLEEARKRESHRKAAMAEHQADKQRSGLSQGLKQVQEGRGLRFEQAQKAIEARQRSATPSHDGSTFDLGRGRSDAGPRASGVQSAPRARQSWERSSLRPEPSGASPGVAGPAGGRSATREAGSRRPSGMAEDVLGERQAERDRRRQAGTFGR